MSGRPADALHFDPTSLRIGRELKGSVTSSVFEAELYGDRYSMKVYHDNGDPGFTRMGRDLNRFRCELNAYRNLQYFGLCERGVVPRYYGYVNRLDPAKFRPHLNHFADDMYSPSAIFLEDLQDAEELNSVNYSDSRIQTAICGLEEIHRALIQRRDIYTKSILIIPGPPERVVGIDFDVAVTFPNKEAMSWQVDVSCKCEVEFAKSIGDHLRKDQRRGIPPNMIYY